MEIVEGPTLAELTRQGPRPITEVLEFGRQLAEGLAEAHEKGILHRDLKTRNIILHRLNRVKILDFGLAKLLGDETGEMGLSQSGQIVGTCHAMSPEQARGMPLDARSDLFSLGTVLYEMTTGGPAFTGTSPLDTLQNVVSSVHPRVIDRRPEAPARLVQMIDRLLEKAREHRPSSAAEVATELLRIETEPRDPLEESLHDSRPTLDPLSDSASTLDASLFKESGDRHRGRWLPLALVAGLAVALALGLWRGYGDRKPSAPETEITREAELPVTQNGEEDAYTLVRRGMEALERFDKAENLERAIAAFEAVLEQDESSAPAHAGLALAYWWHYDIRRDPLRLEQAEAIARRAVELDEHLAIARTALGTVLARLGRYEEAVRELELALQLSPRDPDAYRGLGLAHKIEGEQALAIDAFENAVAQKPSDAYLRDELGLLYFRAGRYEDAEEQFSKSIAAAPDGIYGYRNLSAVYYMQGRLDESAREVQKALMIEQDPSLYSNLGTILYTQGLYRPAARAFEKALDHGAANDYIYWANLADAHRQSEGFEEEAREAYLQAIRLLETTAGARADHNAFVSRSALYRAKSGRCDAALGALLAEDFEPQKGDDHFRAAVAQEICGERSSALASLEKALAAGFSKAKVLSDPELFGLRSDPRFHRLPLSINTP